MRFSHQHFIPLSPCLYFFSGPRVENAPRLERGFGGLGRGGFGSTPGSHQPRARQRRARIGGRSVLRAVVRETRVQRLNA